MPVPTVFFKNHTGRKKNFASADGNKSDVPVKNRRINSICMSNKSSATWYLSAESSGQADVVLRQLFLQCSGWGLSLAFTSNLHKMFEAPADRNRDRKD